MAPQITGNVVKSVIRDNEVVTEFEIPAVTKSIARRKARINAMVKGLDSPSINSIELVGQADIPGQRLYSVEVVSIR